MLSQIKLLHEYRFHDKSKWGEGEWQNEPDKIQWIDEKTGIDCLAVRPNHGSWCGYAGVKEDDFLFGKPYSNDENFLPDVHGGLTFAGSCREDNPHGICHYVIKEVSNLAKYLKNYKPENWLKKLWRTLRE